MASSNPKYKHAIYSWRPQTSAYKPDPPPAFSSANKKPDLRFYLQAGPLRVEGLRENVLCISALFADSYLELYRHWNRLTVAQVQVNQGVADGAVRLIVTAVTTVKQYIHRD